MSSPRLNRLPVYRQALSLRTLSSELAAFVSYNKDLMSLRNSLSHRDQLADCLLTDATLIPEQIAEAENSSSLAIREQRVQFIGVITRNLNAYVKGLEMDGIREREYLELLRREVRIFRVAFKKWRKSVLR
ncbi:hypothetical protein SAMN04490243_2458 [Robiginitalea myxolifaciens]|uniref:Four helix bundle protein n=2 Tax=Robiginitalea myxolifaciens TaxID=400055 RepID=A0A1I6HA34_9FLAO|nr:hypothetical protein SAMN04490243_2458 [Robiginitalea myxolifaciens]